MVPENWREAIEALRAEIWKMKQENLDLQNELVKLRRTYDDQIYNLDLDNMPRLKKIALQTDDGVAGLVIRIDNAEAEVELLAQRQTEQGSSIANIDAKADSNSARIHQVALVQAEHEKSMAEIEQTAEENAAEMKLIVEVQAEQSKSIASVDEKATENAASIEQVARVQTEQGESIAAVKQDVEENSASIEQVAKTQSEQGESLARVEQKASENTASIEQVAMVQTEQGESIASIDAKVDENSSAIRLEVHRVGGVAAEAVEKANNAENTAEEANARVSNGAYIIASINDDGSVIKIRADKLELSGYATFASLENEGETAINGGNIIARTLSVDALKLNENGQINFNKLGSLTFEDPAGGSGSIRVGSNEMNKGEIIAETDGTVAITTGDASVGVSEGFINLEGQRMQLFAPELNVNGKTGLNGTFSVGNGTITVVNGIVVDVSAEGGGGYVLYAPETYMDGTDGYSFTITNPNGYGDIVYWTIWKDSSSGETGMSQYMRSSDSVVTGYVEEFPPSSGFVGIEAYVEYNGSYSDTSRDTQEYA